MLYAHRKYRGLGLIYSEKEVILQHYSIAKRLSSVNNDLFQSVYDCESEMRTCKEMIGVDGKNVKELRNAVREREFDKWCDMSYAGVGVRHFKSYTPSNQFVCKKESLSSSEWCSAIKLNYGYANLSGVPGVQAPNRLCRRCGGEIKSIETISHVLGACSFGANRRTARHHNLKHQIAKLLRGKGFHTIDEAYCKDGHGSNRFIDILVFEPGSDRAYIVDPTIRYETNGDCDLAVRNEKTKIYESCTHDLNERYKSYGVRKYEVIGVWMGARGSVGQSLLDLFRRFDIDTSVIKKLSEEFLISSLKMIHHHIYS